MGREGYTFQCRPDPDNLDRLIVSASKDGFHVHEVHDKERVSIDPDWWDHVTTSLVARIITNKARRAQRHIPP